MVLLWVFSGRFILINIYFISFNFFQQDAHSPSPHTALLLHRLGLDCGLQSQNPGFNCSTTQGQVSVLTDKTSLPKKKMMSTHINIHSVWMHVGLIKAIFSLLESESLIFLPSSPFLGCSVGWISSSCSPCLCL